jgi:hypothetical protein
MAALSKVHINLRALLKEIEQFRKFLAKNPRGERKQFLPFFKKHPQLCLFLATFNDAVTTPTHIAPEFSLWGDFVCDLVTGNKQEGAFVFVEFEDAKKRSLFRKKKRRRNTLWGTRVEAAISQINDWMYRLYIEVGSVVHERDLGIRQLKSPVGLIVVGRRSEVSPTDRARLEWRSGNTRIGGSKVAIFTYDDLYDWLYGRARMFESSTEPEN